MNLKETVEEMNRMIMSGQNMEAFEKYYHDDVVMQENANPICEVKAVAIGDNTTMVEWSFDMTYKGGNRSKMEQVAVQRWKDGKIIHERFYYNSPK